MKSRKVVSIRPPKNFEAILEQQGSHNIVHFCDEILICKYSEQIHFIQFYFLSGGFGVFQFLILVLLLALEIPTAFVSFLPVFVTGIPKTWFCDDVEIRTKEICSCNGTLTTLETDSIVAEVYKLFFQTVLLCCCLKATS
jgi:hypothetical protein